MVKRNSGELSPERVARANRQRIAAEPCATVLRLIRALPGERPFLPPLLAGPYRQRSARVAAPSPHDFAVRCKRLVRCKHLTPQRPLQPVPTLR